MSDRSKKLADRLNSFNGEVISFVENCTETDGLKICAEEWPVGVTARHIGANHYSAMSGAKMILKGAKFPEMTMEQITENANRHAREQRQRGHLRGYRFRRASFQLFGQISFRHRTAELR
jgi:hypothetical protein